MKKLRPISRIAGKCLVLALALGAAVEAQAQLNDNKVRRDAAGVYSGTAKGGRLVKDYEDPFYSDETSTIPPEKGKVRVPVKKGKLSSKVNDSELPGDGKGNCSGKAKRADVKRGGKRVAIRYEGKAKLDESGHGPWKGNVTGNLDDKGAKWQANTKSSATQVNVQNDYVMNANVKKVTGLSFKGKG